MTLSPENGFSRWLFSEDKHWNRTGKLLYGDASSAQKRHCGASRLNRLRSRWGFVYTEGMAWLMLSRQALCRLFGQGVMADGLALPGDYNCARQRDPDFNRTMR